MASYPKIWTTIESASWWQKLDLNARGAVTQMVIWSKKDGDTGHLEFRSWRFLSERLGCHRDTCTKIVSNLATLGFLELTERPDGTIHIYLPKYIESQRATSHFDVLKMVKEDTESGQIWTKSAQQQNRTEQNQTEQNRSEDDTPPFAVVDNVEKTTALTVLNQYIDDNWQAIWKRYGNPDKGKPLFALEGLKDEFAKMRAWVDSHDRQAFERWGKLSTGGGYMEGVPIWISDWLMRSLNKPTVLRSPFTAQQEKEHYESHRRDNQTTNGFERIVE